MFEWLKSDEMIRSDAIKLAQAMRAIYRSSQRNEMRDALTGRVIFFVENFHSGKHFRTLSPSFRKKIIERQSFYLLKDREFRYQNEIQFIASKAVITWAKAIHHNRSAVRSIMESAICEFNPDLLDILL